jgi:hypothetical protein
MTTLRLCWTTDAPLTATGLLMFVALAASLAGLWLDPRVITGMPAWLKPAKFAISIAIYALTLVWVFTYLPGWTRTRRVVGWTTAITLVLELVIIDAQAWRGTTSHFNVGTPFDAAVFGIMGTAILIAWLASIALTVALFRHRFADEGFAWALRIGMLITVLGQATGGIMTTPTQAQLAAARTTAMTVSGAHTVGAPDGGAGLPITGWSREHGDLRVGHFVGIHAVQLLPALAWLIGPLGSTVRRRRAVLLLATAYFALFGILLAQALMGQPLLAPQGPIAIAFVAWAILSIAGVSYAAGSRRSAAAASLPFVVSR